MCVSKVTRGKKKKYRTSSEGEVIGNEKAPEQLDSLSNPEDIAEGPGGVKYC